ncbi:MAG: hypothetical protein K2J17_07385 [Paramuribaculum sp.]|nr:hypothetical protein [Paramuribaculum sp.]
MNSNPAILSPCGTPADTEMRHLFPDAGESSRLTIVCRREDYSASRLSHAVEDADAHILNLNITDEVPFEGGITVELRISHRHGSAVARSVERYGYTVTRISGHDEMMQLTRERLDELMAHLNV